MFNSITLLITKSRRVNLCKKNKLAFLGPNILCVILINNLVFDLQSISNLIVNILYCLSN